jgi:hypothetical protein
LLKKVKNALSFSIPTIEHKDLLDKKTKKALTQGVKKGLLRLAEPNPNTIKDQNVSKDKE